jgi:hypothetical protein
MLLARATIHHRPMAVGYNNGPLGTSNHTIPSGMLMDVDEEWR